MAGRDAGRSMDRDAGAGSPAEVGVGACTALRGGGTAGEEVEGADTGMVPAYYAQLAAEAARILAQY
jgi:hypothetical protein